MKQVHFDLGPGGSLTSRTLTITRMPNASDGTVMPSAESTQELGDVIEAEAALPSNQIFQATLVDVGDSGETSVTKILNFHTGDLQWPGPSCSVDPLFKVAWMEDLSSSSSSSSSQSSSSSSQSSSSSSSQSSSSSSSQSSSSSSSQSSSSSSSQSSSSST